MEENQESSSNTTTPTARGSLSGRSMKLARKFSTAFVSTVKRKISPRIYKRNVSEFRNMLRLTERGAVVSKYRTAQRLRIKREIINFAQQSMRNDHVNVNNITSTEISSIVKHASSLEDKYETNKWKLVGHDVLSSTFSGSASASSTPAAPIMQANDQEQTSGNKILDQAIEQQAIQEAEQIEEKEENQFSNKRIFYFLTLIFSLFFPDAWAYSNVYPESKDNIFNGIMVGCMFIFLLEILETSMYEAGYFRSTFFFLDMIGTASIVLSLTWVENAIANNGSSLTILRATRASRAGLRARNIVRMLVTSLRLQRVLQPVFQMISSYVISEKHYHHHTAATADAKATDESLTPVGGDDVEQGQGQGQDNSRRQRPLSYKKQKRLKLEEHLRKYNEEQLATLDDLVGKKYEVMESYGFRLSVVVMILVIATPYLQYNPNDTSVNAWLSQLRLLGKEMGEEITTVNSEMILEEIGQKINKFYAKLPASLVSFYMESPYLDSNNSNNNNHIHYIHYNNNQNIYYYYALYDIRPIRHDNLLIYSHEYQIENSLLLASDNPSTVLSVKDPDCSECHSSFLIELTMDETTDNNLTSLFSILLTVLTVILLYAGTASFSKVSNEQLITPLKNILLISAEDDNRIKKQQHEEDNVNQRNNNNDSSLYNKAEFYNIHAKISSRRSITIVTDAGAGDAANKDGGKEREEDEEFRGDNNGGVTDEIHHHYHSVSNESITNPQGDQQVGKGGNGGGSGGGSGVGGGSNSSYSSSSASSDNGGEEEDDDDVGDGEKEREGVSSHIEKQQHTSSSQSHAYHGLSMHDEMLRKESIRQLEATSEK